MSTLLSAHTPASAGLALHAAAPLPQPSVSVRGLKVGFGRHVVLDGLDWNLHPGQVVGLLGRNGAGKTTLLESLLGLREPSAGHIDLFGAPLAQLSDRERARLGYVAQQSDLFEWLSPAQLLAYFRSFYPRWNDAKVEDLLSRWQIDRNKPIGQLSGGQKQRLSIVRALAHEPDLLVLDEPVASLDPAGRRDFLRELVEQVIDRGTTVVFSTHILSDLERVAFNVAFLSKGRIALQAPLDELIDTTRRVAGPLADVEAWCRHERLHVLHRDAAGGEAGCMVRIDPARPLAAPQGVRVDAVTLEDLFLELTQ